MESIKLDKKNVEKSKTVHLTVVRLLCIIVQEVKETKIMKETKIKLGLEDVKEFVTAAAKCDFDIDVNYNRVLVDMELIHPWRTGIGSWKSSDCEMSWRRCSI